MKFRHILNEPFIICLILFLFYPVKPNMMQKLESKKKIKVFILAGQSNMEGRADANKLHSQDQERLKQAQENVQLAFNNEPIGPLRPVKPSLEIAEIYKREIIFGPELFFGISLSEAWPDEKILLIKLSEGGTSLHGCWNPEWSDEKAVVMGEEDELKLYQSLINHVKKTLSVHTSDEYEICAMLWVQGETDSENEIAAAAYEENLRKLIAHVREDINSETLPFLLFQVGSGKVVEGMVNVSHEISNVILLEQSLDPGSENFYSKMKNGHYNYLGMKKLGQKFAEVYFQQFTD